MNKIFILLIVLIISCKEIKTTSTEKKVIDLRTQKLKSTEVYFHASEKVSGSNFYIYPISSSLDEIDKSYYSKSGIESKIWNIAFYNIKTGKKHLLINDRIPIIEHYPSHNDFEYLEENEIKNIINQKRKVDKLFFEIRMEDINNDGIIDQYDPNGLFVSDLDGSNLKRISPKDLNLNNWKFLDNDKKLIELRCIALNYKNHRVKPDEEKVLLANLDSLEKGCIEVFSERFKLKLKEDYIDKK